MPAARPLEQRFWEKVDKSADCWEWTASRDVHGYGAIGLSRKVVKAHRVSWEFAYGSIPAGVSVCHSCDNPGCVKPDHLFLGSHLANMRDMYAKGRRRAPIGEKNPRAVLDWSRVREIRWRAANGEPLARLAREFGVGRTTLGAVVYRRSWTDDPLGDDIPMPVVRKGRPPTSRGGV